MLQRGTKAGRDVDPFPRPGASHPPALELISALRMLPGGGTSIAPLSGGWVGRALWWGVSRGALFSFSGRSWATSPSVVGHKYV